MEYHRFESIEEIVDELRSKDVPLDQVAAAERFLRFLDSAVPGYGRSSRSPMSVFQWVPQPGGTEFVSCYKATYAWLEWDPEQITGALGVHPRKVDRFVADIRDNQGRIDRLLRLELLRLTTPKRYCALEAAVRRLFDVATDALVDADGERSGTGAD